MTTQQDPDHFDAGEEEAEAEELLAETEAFERVYVDDHSWEDLEEDEFGRLRPLDMKAEQRAKRRKLLTVAQSARIRRGMIRYLEVVIDLSRAAALTDFRPMRITAMSGVLQLFIREFFDQNPLSQLGLLVLRNGVAERLTELSGSPEAHIAKLRGSLGTEGDASLQNGLDLVVASLRSVPPYGQREVLLLFAGLSTCDPGNIQDSIKAAKQHRCRVSIVGLAAEVHICRVITDATGGVYGVALDEQHMQDLVMEQCNPPPSSANSTQASLVSMGFPKRNAEGASAAVFLGADCQVKSGGYTCPKCKARVTDLPCACHVCGLTLISSPHLARSYHHLFPVKPFEEVPADKWALQRDAAAAATDMVRAEAGPSCYGCSRSLDYAAAGEEVSEGGVVVTCPDCRHLFCFDCDTFVHEMLHNCPGCERQGAVGMDVGD